MKDCEFREQLLEFLATDDLYLWIIEDRVWSENGTDLVRQALDEESSSDFLGTVVRSYESDPDWTWWKDLRAPMGLDPLEFGIAALIPLIRLSRQACTAILDGMDEGWSGHPEALLPTLVHRAGLKIEDVGGCGGFTPPERIGRWYDHRTWHWQGPVEHVSGMLHYPVPLRMKKLAEGRLKGPMSSLKNNGWKMLYVSPVGGEASDLLPMVMNAFERVGADCWLLQYDDSELDIAQGARSVRDKGYKWQLAERHLHPDTVSDYDLIFFWDDDLGVSDFDPLRFARIMKANQLDMAQPAVQSPHGLSHAITRHRPCPPPWRDPDGVTVHPVVGRLTNFVEIMAPVFTRDAWREFYSYLDSQNRTGWGYDYIPLGRKGIVDVMPVVHTRAVQSINGESESEIRRFLESQGLFRHAHVDQGWLFEH